MTNEKAINTINSLKQYYNDKNEDSYVGFDDEDNEALDMAIKALEQTRWIPVSERLPKENQDCLATDGNEIYFATLVLDEFDDDFEPIYTWYSEYLYEPENIIAWMPLPEPYKEVGDDT